MSGCHYLPDLIAVRRADLSRAIELLDGTSLFETPITYVSQYDDDQPDHLDMSHLSERTIATMDSLVGFVRLAGGDPHEVAKSLRDREDPIQAAPVHGLGRLNHISAMEGTKPTKADAPSSEAGASHYPDPYGVIAVVDSGVSPDMPEWMTDGLRFDDPDDIDVRPTGSNTSHGTFVASLIRSISPNHVVSVARARDTPTNRFKSGSDSGNEGGAPFLVTELDVLGAVVRLVERHAGDPVDALNMSLGGFACGPDDSAMLTLSLALDYWRQHFPRSPVFAAGGNADDPRPVYPGAFNHVRAVGAGADGTGELVTWDLPAGVRTAEKTAERQWITDIAPGADLVGLSGAAADQWVTWSGSSFACAVAAACYSSRRPMEASEDRVWWCDRSVRYDAIAGLRF